MSGFIIAGSRSYGLNVEGSDIDVMEIWGRRYTRSYDKSTNINLIQVNRNEIPKRMVDVDHAYLQWWFPAEFLAKDKLTEYVLAERERFVSERRGYIYRRLFDHAEGLWTHSDWLYDGSPKRLAYSTLFYAIPARYAEGRTFAEAHRMDGELQKQLLAMRRHEIDLEKAQEINRLWHDRAVQAASFFDVVEDDKYVMGVSKQLSKLLNINE